MGNPYQLTSGFATNPDSEAYRWLAKNLTTPWRRDLIRTRIAEHYCARWFAAGGDYTSFVRGFVDHAEQRGTLPVLVPYNIMGRDLGQYSSGGAVSIRDYITWLQHWVRAIGTRPAIVLLEPDSIIHMDGMDDYQSSLRAAALTEAIWTIRTHCPNTWVYLDAGVRSDWHNPEVLAQDLLRSGITGARGVFVNCSNFLPTSEAAGHAQAVLDAVTDITGQDYGFVIDTSRNGRGFPPVDYINANPGTWWCNPPGRMLGAVPAFENSVGADALLWGKEPGVSDGLTGQPTGVPSGVFDHRIATSLILGRWTP